jgi:integrase
MAAVQERHGSYRVIFRYHGKQHSFTLGEVSSDEAATKVGHVEYLLMRLKQRLATLPPGTDIVEYLQFDGKQPIAAGEPAPSPAKATLDELRKHYVATHRSSLEANTLATVELHFRHLVRFFGEAYPLAELALAELQRYIDHRATARGTNGRKLSANTMLKEIKTLRTAWGWGGRMGLVTGSFPSVGLRYPKITEKPAFQTLAEIERQIKIGGLNEAEQADLYDVLYLQLHETAELLQYVKATAAHGFLHPMFCMAAHTGARRSELLRMKVADMDLAGKTVTIHERKRVQGMATTRRVPMSAFLVGVMTEWVAEHPGGPWLFCHEAAVARSRKRSPTTGHQGQKTRPKSGKARQASVKMRGGVAAAPLTKDEANHHFRMAVAGSKWEMLRGWHALRHSFVSACASRGVDQRLVEAWAGHMSPAMSRRYMHLYPSVQQQALSAVFDAA